MKEAAESTGWSIPAEVPALVRRGYSGEALGPEAWKPDLDAARDEWMEKKWLRRSKAQEFLLAGPDALGTGDLAGLHDIRTPDLDDEHAVAAVVRDGPESVEVILVRVGGSSGHRTLSGQSIGVAGSAIHDPEVAEAVMRVAVRAPPRDSVTRAARAELMAVAVCGEESRRRRAPAPSLYRPGAAPPGR